MDCLNHVKQRRDSRDYQAPESSRWMPTPTSRGQVPVSRKASSCWRISSIPTGSTGRTNTGRGRRSARLDVRRACFLRARHCKYAGRLENHTRNEVSNCALARFCIIDLLRLCDQVDAILQRKITGEHGHAAVELLLEACIVERRRDAILLF